MLYSNQASMYVLSCLMQNPQILVGNKYNLTKDDFRPNEFHKIMFVCTNNLANKGIKEVSALDIGNYIEPYRAQKEVLEDNNYIEFIDTIKQLTNDDNIEPYVNELKKYSLLRTYKENGFDITKFYDESKDELEQKELLNKYEISDIIRYFDGLQSNIKKEFNTNTDITEENVGNGLRELKEKFKEAPLYGATSFSDTTNTLTRGLVNGELTLYGMPSGTGKSTLAIKTCALFSALEIWSNEEQRFIKNPYYKAPSVYIEFEMSQEQVKSKFIGAISGVESHKFTKGQYTKEEEKRIDYAIDIYERSEIYVVVMPSFTLSLIENYCDNYVLNKGCRLIVYDYICEQSSVSSEIAIANKVATRSDMVLASISAKLKEIALRLNVPVLTFCQCNKNAEEQEILSASSLAGSRAIQDKCDVAGIMMQLRKKELALVDKIDDRRGFDNLKPNRIIHFFKCRWSQYEQDLKLWVHVDLATGVVTDCFVTDKWNHLKHIPKTKLGNFE